MTTVTIKARIYPTSEQASLLLATMQQYRNACNLVSQYYFDHNFVPKQKDINKALYHKVRNQFGLKAQMTQSVFKTVIAKYKTVETQLKKKPYSFKDNNTDTWYTEKRDLSWLQKPINFKRPQCDLVSARDWSFKNDKLSLNTLANREIMNFSMKGFEQYLDSKLGTAKLVKSCGHYFLHISATVEPHIFKKADLKHVVGIDRGLRFLATTYDEKDKTSFIDGKAIIAKRRKYKKLRQQLQSKGTKSAKRRLKAIGQRENRWMSDINHQITKTLTDKYGKDTLFVLEDLTNVRFATEKVAKTNRYEQVSWAFYQFEQFLTYKAELNGSKVIKVSAQYTSQRCPKCGSINKNNRKHDIHEYQCANCDYKSNDDRIGAMNIQYLGTNWVTGDTTKITK